MIEEVTNEPLQKKSEEEMQENDTAAYEINGWMPAMAEILKTNPDDREEKVRLNEGEVVALGNCYKLGTKKENGEAVATASLAMDKGTYWICIWPRRRQQRLAFAISSCWLKVFN